METCVECREFLHLKKCYMYTMKKYGIVPKRFDIIFTQVTILG